MDNILVIAVLIALLILELGWLTDRIAVMRRLDRVADNLERDAGHMRAMVEDFETWLEQKGVNR